MENTLKIHTLYSSIKRKAGAIDINGEEITENKSYMLQFIDSAKLMASSSSNLVNNLYEGIHRIKRKLGHGEYCKY